MGRLVYGGKNVLNYKTVMMRLIDTERVEEAKSRHSEMAKTLMQIMELEVTVL